MDEKKTCFWCKQEGHYGYSCVERPKDLVDAYVRGSDECFAHKIVKDQSKRITELEAVVGHYRKVIQKADEDDDNCLVVHHDYQERLRKENQRLRELLKRCYPFLGYRRDESGVRIEPSSVSSGQLKQEIIEALKEADKDGISD
jgi:hypothetical protein